MSNVDTNYDFSLDLKIPKDPNTGTYKKLGQAIGAKMQDSEKNLFEAFKSGKEGDIQAAMVVYQKWQRLMEMFTTLIKAIHDIFMSIIRKIAL